MQDEDFVFVFASAGASSPKRSSLRFHCCIAVFFVRFGVPYLFHSMYDGLGGSCSNFHFGRRAALTLKVLKRLSSFLDEKFRAPLILKVGWNCLDEQCFVRVADTICVASISRVLGACGFF